MKKLLFTVVMLLSLMAMARANLWETEDQIAARYDAPTGSPTENNGHLVKRFYKYNGTDITVVFLNGKSQYEEYTTLSTDAAINAFLGANAGKYFWKQDLDNSQDEKTRTWSLNTLEDTVAKAIYRSGKLVIATNEFLQFMADTNKQGKGK